MLYIEAIRPTLGRGDRIMRPNSDRLNSIRERLRRENDKKSLLPSAHKIETAEAEILKAIILHDPDGISHVELAKII